MFFETVLSSQPAFAADVLVKATLLLASVILIDLCLRKGSAAMRHRVWTMSFVGLLFLPILSYVVPQYRVAILPADWFAHEPTGDSSPVNFTTVPMASASENSVPSASPSDPTNFRDWQLEETQLGGNRLAPPSLESSLDPRSAPTTNTDDRKQNPTSFGWFLTIKTLGLVWPVGCLIAVSPLILGIWRIRLLHRKSPKVLDHETIRTLAELCRRLGIFRPVRLLETEQSIVPMTWGLFGPVVLLPASWRRWASERQRLVLLHELAHVKRFDVVTQSIARLAVSLYWFHPMAWYAIRRLRVERELACDDCVLMSGERPSQYAEQLLSIAREFQSLEMPPAVAMAQRSGLENRVRAMLDQARSHLPLNPRVAGGMLVMTIATLLLLAPLRLGAITPAAVVESDSVASLDEPKTASSKSAKNQMHISGTVTSPDNQPLAGARVTVLRKFLANPSWSVHYEKLLETKSDAAGRFDVDVPAISDRFSNGHHFEEQRTIVHASKEGYGPDEADVETLKNAPNLQLATATKKIRGRFLDLEGKPIAGVKVKLVKIEKAGASIALWLENARNNPATLNDPRMMMAQPIAATNWPRLATFPSRGEITAVEILGPIEAQSDSNGEFTLAGIGDDRQATLLVESPTTATTWLHCVTHEMASVNMPSMDPRFRVGRTFGAKFDYSAEPSQWVQGIVRDKRTGTPLKDVVVSLHQFGDSLLSIEDFIQCTTDSNGRYLLKGIPKAPEGSNGVKLRILPSAEQPYFRSEHPVPKSMGLEPVELNLALTKGIWIEGQVTDAKTKAPLPAMVAYYPRRENQYAENHETWRLNLISMGYEDLIATDASGRFRVPGLPGAGVLRVVAANDTEYELADGLPPGIETSPRKYYHCDSAGNAMAELDIAPDESLHRVDVAVKPLAMRSIQVVDAVGNDVMDYYMAGRLPVGRPTIGGRGKSYWAQNRLDTAHAEYYPGEGADRERPLMFLDAERKLGAVIPIETLEGKSDEIARITLLPTVKIKGRLVDANGNAMKDGYVKAGVGITEFRAMFPTSNGGNAITRSTHPKYPLLDFGKIDERGMFELAVPPGKGYCLVVLGGQSNKILFRDRELLPGQTIDLGSVDVAASDIATEHSKKIALNPDAIPNVADSQVAEQAKAASPKASDALIFKGKVLQPDGTPAAGASLHWVYYEPGRFPDASIPPVAVTDAKGEFEIHGAPGDGTDVLVLVATKPGFAFASGKPGVFFETTGKLAANSRDGMALRLLGMFGVDKTLRLVDDDKPLTGRILTVEGVPVSNVQIRVKELRSNPKGNLDGWEKESTNSKADYYSLAREAPDVMNGFQLPSIVRDVTTDTNGKFTIKGLGKERIAQLIISGPGIETSIVFARTREGKTIRVPHQFGNDRFGLPVEVFYPNGFDFVAAPSVPVEGKILDDSTGTQLSGFLVTAGRQVMTSVGGKPYISTVTDKDGRYTLTGLSKNGEDILYVIPPRGSKYLPMGVRPKTKDARQAIKLDLKLRPVSILRGRVMDAATGKPIPGAIQYYALVKNPNLADHRSFEFANYHECRTDQNGYYEIAVLPGEGLLSFDAMDHTRYPRAASLKTNVGMPVDSPSEKRIYQSVPFYLNAANHHFVKELNIEKEATDVEINVGISSGKSLAVRVVDSNGKPASRAILKGTSELSGWHPVLDGATEIEGYLPDQGRELFAYDLESQQAAYFENLWASIERN